jgi:carbon storage regulator CsrA
MLFITRRIGQGITIGKSICIKVTGINKYGIEIGIDAPREMEINRLDKKWVKNKPDSESKIWSNNERSK